ncbi:MAG: hypothetical protein ASUL_01450 [Candidatus Aramenus sulfurataquae]|uniref:Uncharacterized protein n=2 Tax=Candidatus Aramenus sulfurataquae TaxID=1326980 RepID=W7KZN9_9CREN|nr:MAG: hypothetical protein ASUL_01450 [Candidatus Aramenus sulfurataquae]MBW9141477.1 hypothetical protein [Candidatus Aramenus sp.]MCL7343438.1 hypothetical protein [Candidatus Aramenus sulfurataquae]
MNENEVKVLKVLKDFEQYVEDHSLYLQEIENLIAINRPDYERATRLLRRIRRVRKNLIQGAKIIMENISQVSDPKVKEESIGIVSYLSTVGFRDERELLINLNDVMKKSGQDLGINEDIQQLNDAMSSLSKLSF